ncbi:ribonuclease H-like domain-containing protein [Tanacetum coccineum]
MYDEYNALVKNDTWLLVPRPTSINMVHSMWLFKHKFHADGTLSRYNACLVANGSSQQLGVDLMRLLARLSNQLLFTWFLAFSCLPPGFVDARFPNHVYRLQRSFYGLKQAPHAWFQHFTGLFMSQKKYALQLLERAHMLYASATTSLVGYIDADLAGYPSTRSTKAEYRGVANVVAKTAWLHNLLHELHSPLLTATLIYCDNVSAIYMSANPIQHQQTKHIEIDIRFVRDMVTAGQVRIINVPSHYQYADIFTKGLTSALFENFRSTLSFHPPPTPTAEAWFSDTIWEGGILPRNGLRFEVDFSSEFLVGPIPFRRRVFESGKDGKHITAGILLEKINNEEFDTMNNDDIISLCLLGILELVLLGHELRYTVPEWCFRLVDNRNAWNMYPWGSYAWPTLYEQLRDANVKRWEAHFAIDRQPDSGRPKYSLMGFICAFKAMRGGRPMKGPVDVGEHYGLRLPTGWRCRPGIRARIQPLRTLLPLGHNKHFLCGLLPIRPQLTPHPNMAIMNRERREFYLGNFLRSPYMPLPATTVVPKKRAEKSRKKTSNANILAFDLRNAVGDDNARDDEVRITSACATRDFISLENVDPNKVVRDHYVECLTFLYNPKPVFLDCHIKGFRAMESFWQELVPQMYKGSLYTVPDPPKWQINAWMELLVRTRPHDARRTVAKSGTASLNPSSNIFLLQTDQHLRGTLDGSTRPYPSWDVVDWVFMPIYAGGDHWVTEWTEVLNDILEKLGHFERTRRRPYNFQYLHNEGPFLTPQQTNFADYRVVTC